MSDSFKQPYADAGHDIESLFAPGRAYRCERCGSAQIDLSEDLVYGKMRRCAPSPSTDPETLRARAAEIARGLSENEAHVFKQMRWRFSIPQGNQTEFVRTFLWKCETELGLLINPDFDTFFLTPLGIAVREYLQGNPHDD